MTKKNIRRALLALGFLVLLGSGVFIALRWSAMPDQIATHFNAAGQIDGWNSKSTIIVLPIVGLVVYGLICFVSLLPANLWNTPGNRPVRNAETARIMMAVMALAAALAFSYMTVCSVQCTPLGRWFLPVFIAGLALPFIGSLIVSLVPGKK